MAVKVTAWVWEHSRSKLGARLVLLAIADHANGDGVDAFPSIAQLMHKTGLTERAVQKAVAELVKLGELHVAVGGGRGRTSRYRVLMVERPAEAVNPAEKTPYKERGKENPVKETPYSTQETPQNPTLNPAEFAPVTKYEPRATVKDSPSGSPARARTRGTRLPPDFMITDQMWTWAAAEATKVTGQPPTPETFSDWLDRHTEIFRDHWIGKPSPHGLKLDWVATWRNWMRKEIDKVGQQPRAAGTAVARYGQNGNGGYTSTSDAKVAQTMALKQKFEGK